MQLSFFLSFGTQFRHNISPILDLRHTLLPHFMAQGTVKFFLGAGFGLSNIKRYPDRHTKNIYNRRESRRRLVIARRSICTLRRMAGYPKLKNCRQHESMKPAKTAEVITDVVTIATPTTRNVRPGPANVSAHANSRNEVRYQPDTHALEHDRQYISEKSPTMNSPEPYSLSGRAVGCKTEPDLGMKASAPGTSAKRSKRVY